MYSDWGVEGFLHEVSSCVQFISPETTVASKLGGYSMISRTLTNADNGRDYVPNMVSGTSDLSVVSNLTDHTGQGGSLSSKGTVPAQPMLHMTPPGRNQLMLPGGNGLGINSDTAVGPPRAAAQVNLDVGLAELPSETLTPASNRLCASVGASVGAGQESGAEYKLPNPPSVDLLTICRQEQLAGPVSAASDSAKDQRSGNGSLAQGSVEPQNKSGSQPVQTTTGGERSAPLAVLQRMCRTEAVAKNSVNLIDNTTEEESASTVLAVKDHVEALGDSEKMVMPGAKTRKENKSGEKMECVATFRGSEKGARGSKRSKDACDRAVEKEAPTRLLRASRRARQPNPKVSVS